MYADFYPPLEAPRWYKACRYLSTRIMMTIIMMTTWGKVCNCCQFKSNKVSFKCVENYYSSNDLFCQPKFFPHWYLYVHHSIVIITYKRQCLITHTLGIYFAIFLHKPKQALAHAVVISNEWRREGAKNSLKVVYEAKKYIVAVPRFIIKHHPCWQLLSLSFLHT